MKSFELLQSFEFVIVKDGYSWVTHIHTQTTETCTEKYNLQECTHTHALFDGTFVALCVLVNDQI